MSERRADLSDERARTAPAEGERAMASPSNRAAPAGAGAGMSAPCAAGVSAPFPAVHAPSAGGLLFSTPSTEPRHHRPSSSPAARCPLPRMAASSAAGLPPTACDAAASPSQGKRKIFGEKQKKAPGKRFKSPVVPMAVRSPGIRLMLSPRLMPQSTTAVGSPSTALPATTSDVVSPHNKTRPSRGKRRRKLKSEIWKDFEPIYDGKTVLQAKCIHCSRIFKASRSVGTSACIRHLDSCDGRAKVEQMVDQMNSNASLKDWKFDQELSRTALVKLIVVHELPFSFVEYPMFRKFVASLNPWFELVSRTTIKADCMEAYEGMKAKLREILRKSTSKVSLTADMWTSNQTLGYLCVTCHYIDDDWKIQKRIIKFTLVETPHDARTMFNAMLKSIQDWNIEDNIFAITLDNASVNDSFVKSLQENLVAKRLLVCKGELFHCRCAAHVFNLIAQEGFKAISDATFNIRESVKYVKSSQARKQRFEEMVDQVGISEKRPCLDVPTRWNSTYEMLKTALQYKRAFEALHREDTQYVYEPSDDEWSMAANLCDLLEVFFDATNAVSGSKYPTVSCYFHMIWEVKKVLERESSNPDLVIATMVYDMKRKLKKYWDLSFLKICVPIVFDPRFKLKYLEFRLRQGFDDTTSSCLYTIEKTVRNLFDEYSSQVGDSTLQNSETLYNEFSIDEGDPWADWRQHQSVQQIKTTSELDRYLEEELVPVGVDFDILQFWKMYSTKYPVLASMARDILAVPASTVASESAFSTAERVISDYRSRLSSNTAEALICLQDWIRASDSTHDNIAGNLTGDDDDF